MRVEIYEQFIDCTTPKLVEVIKSDTPPFDNIFPVELRHLERLSADAAVPSILWMLDLNDSPPTPIPLPIFLKCLANRAGEAAIAPNDKAKWDTVMRFFEDVWKVQRKFLREIVVKGGSNVMSGERKLEYWLDRA